MTSKPTALGGARPLLAGSALGISQSAQGYSYQFPPGSYTFTPPVSGRWKFVLWGPGGADGVNASASGGYCEITRPLTPGQPVALVVGESAAGAPTTATFSDGKVVTAGAAVVNTPGAATGGDVNLAGSVAGVAGLGTGGGAVGNGGAGAGAGAPANLPFRGGAGGNHIGAVNHYSGRTPGGGASDTSQTDGGDGLIIAFLVG